MMSDGGTLKVNKSSNLKLFHKYLVLLEDCVAIKFVPFDSNTPTVKKSFKTQTLPSASYSNKPSSSKISNSSTNVSQDHQLFNGDYHQDKNQIEEYFTCNLQSGYKDTTTVAGSSNVGGHKQNNSTLLNQHHYPKVSTAAVANDGSSNNFNAKCSLIRENSKEVYHEGQQRVERATPTRPSSGNKYSDIDQTLKGISLYKGFRDSNLQCYWNSAIHKTFQMLQYKGFIVPTTILVSAPPKCLRILSTAWSRKMLRSCPGYRIEFLGKCTLYKDGFYSLSSKVQLNFTMS